jgi:hypothetical protein
MTQNAAPNHHNEGNPAADSNGDKRPPPEKLKWYQVRLGPEYINDKQFMKDLQQLKDLRSYLIRDAVKLDAPPNSDLLSFGGLNLLRYNAFGRAPTETEWLQLEKHTQTLFRLPAEASRRKFLFGGIPWWMSVVPVVLGGVAFGSLSLSVLLGTKSVGSKIETLPAIILPFCSSWLASMGAIGAIAFIGMNALSVQEDITFDLTNSRLMTLRIVLGALFGLILTLPFGFTDFVQFCGNIADGTLVADDKATKQAIFLLLPFVLGFSTPLVILVLNRSVEAIQSFFGKSSSLAGPPANTVRPP